MALPSKTTIAAQIRALQPGHSFSRSRRIPLHRDTGTNASAELSKLRNLLNQTVGRIRKEASGSNFRVESAVGITDDKKAMLATVAVTNLDDADLAEVEEDEDDIDI